MSPYVIRSYNLIIFFGRDSNYLINYFYYNYNS